MGKDRFPNAQFKLVHQIRHKHLIKIETMFKKPDRKCILEIDQKEPLERDENHLHELVPTMWAEAGD
ncbi:MAG TPA: hypothetical protein VIL90_06620 [Puia sp.]